MSFIEYLPNMPFDLNIQCAPEALPILLLICAKRPLQTTLSVRPLWHYETHWAPIALWSTCYPREYIGQGIYKPPLDYTLSWLLHPYAQAWKYEDESRAYLYILFVLMFYAFSIGKEIKKRRFLKFFFLSIDRCWNLKTMQSLLNPLLCNKQGKVNCL